MSQEYPKLYKRDSKGKLRVWWMEQSRHCHCTHSGLVDGKVTTTAWTACEPTNEGRANFRDSEAQATFEIKALYDKKRSGEYHDTPEAAEENGAKFFKPMLAAKYSKFEPGFIQPKLDGVRCIANRDGLFSRTGKPIPGAPHVWEELAPVFEQNPDLVLDGELYNHALKDDFNELISLIRKANPSPERLEQIRTTVQYHVYDLPSMDANFSDRSDALEQLLDDLNCPFIIDVETLECDEEEVYDEYHGKWMSVGYEGSMWRANKPYEQKRSKTLLKRKEFHDAEFELFAIERGLGNWSELAKRVVFKVPGANIKVGDEYIEDGVVKKLKTGEEPGPDAVRACGGGIKGSMARAKELLNETHHVVTIQYFELTPDGVPRFPVAIKFHGAARTM